MDAECVIVTVDGCEIAAVTVDDDVAQLDGEELGDVDAVDESETTMLAVDEIDDDAHAVAAALSVACAVIEATLAVAAADCVTVEVSVTMGDAEPLDVRLDVMSGEPEKDVVALGHVDEDRKFVTDTVAVVESVIYDADDVGEAVADKEN